MRRSGAQFLTPPRTDTRDDALPGENKGWRIRGEVDLPTQLLKMAGRRWREATCATCHLGRFVVVVHSRRFCRAQEPLESARDFVSIRRKPVKGACIGDIRRVLAEVRIEFGRAGEGSQLIRIAEVPDVCVNGAL